MPVLNLRPRRKLAAVPPPITNSRPLDPLDAARAELAEANARVAQVTAECERLAQPAQGLERARQAVADAQATLNAVRGAEAADGERWAHDGGAMPKPRTTEREAAQRALDHAKALLEGAERADANRNSALTAKHNELAQAAQAQRRALATVIRVEVFAVECAAYLDAALELNKRWAAIWAVADVLQGDLAGTGQPIFNDRASVPRAISLPAPSLIPDGIGPVTVNTPHLQATAAAELRETIEGLRALLPEPEPPAAA